MHQDMQTQGNEMIEIDYFMMLDAENAVIEAINEKRAFTSMMVDIDGSLHVFLNGWWQRF
jgi:hypothetical protein